MNIIKFIRNIFRDEPKIPVVADTATSLPVDLQPKPKRKKSKKRAFGSVSATFKERAKRMQVGQTRTFSMPDLPDMSINRYAAIISSWCVSNWGKGSAITRRKGESIVLKRIA